MTAPKTPSSPPFEGQAAKCDVCAEDRPAEWSAPIGGGGEILACGECVRFHATNRYEPGLTWTRLDGKARQTDGIIVVGGDA